MVESETKGYLLLSIGEEFNVDFWSAVRVGKSVTMMVAPEDAQNVTSELESAKIQYSVLSDNVEELVKRMPKMKLYKKHTQNGIHSMDWEHYHDLATMYDYLDYLMSKHY